MAWLKITVMSMSVLFSWLFGHSESLAFLESERTNLTPKQFKRMFSVNFSKVQQLSENVSKKCGYFILKVGTNLSTDTYRRLFEQKTMYFCGKKCGFWTVLWGQR